MASVANNGEVQERTGQRGKRVTQHVSVLRRTVFRAVILFLVCTPAFLMIAAFSRGSALREVLAQVTVFWFPLWAMFAVWVAFEASVLYGLVGPRPDPLAPRTLKLSALGVANVIAMFLFLILTRQ